MNEQTEQFNESKSDAELEQSYMCSQGLNTQDAGRAFYLREIKKRAKLKGYKVTGFNKMPIKQLFAIYNQTNK